MSITQQYSGIVLNQNAVPEDPADTLSLTGGSRQYYQTFQLPADYTRGSHTIPSVTGCQIFLNVTDPATAAIAWEFARFDGADWVPLAQDATTGAAHTGNGWFTIFFGAPVAIPAKWLTSSFRILLTGSGGANALPYSVPNPLSTGQAFEGNTGNFPSVLNDPAPTNLPDDLTTAVSDNSRSVSLMFRILATTADSGTDFLGNVYRSAVVTSSAIEVTPVSDSTYWLSSPSPSRFAVQSLYLDETVDDQAVVVDRLTLDAITPGVQFHVYYSNDPTGPGTDLASWGNLLWTPIYKAYQVTSKQTFAFPEPVYAKYFKIEFTDLQARPYDPGPFQIPSTYNKHPQWLLDYFLAAFGDLKLDLLSTGIEVVYDALDLAFSTYDGDIVQEPQVPALSQVSPTLVPQYPQAADNQVDVTTLSKISYNFRPLTAPLSSLGGSATLLGSFLASVTDNGASIEDIARALGDTSLVSNTAREALLIEKAFPLMFFYLPCRHAYRVAQAEFTKGIAYYAGVRSLTLHRDIYTHAIDQVQYNEIIADGANLLINDWSG